MSSPTQIKRPGDDASGQESLPPLVNGDRLDQPTFHRRYLGMPKGIRAELIGGVVYMHSPAKIPHGRISSRVVAWLVAYEEETPGTQAYDNVSNLIGPENEPQPGACLLIAPACGGQTSEKEDWIVGAPELIAEVALTTESIDLHAKKDAYQECGVKEYVVFALKQQRVYWYVNRDEVLTETSPGGEGFYRSEVFPGLWLDPVAMLAGDMPRVRAALAAGLATPEHAAFVEHLRAASGGNSP